MIVSQQSFLTWGKPILGNLFELSICIYTHFQSVYLYFVYLHFQPMYVLTSKIESLPTPFVNEINLSYLYILGILPEYQLTVYTCIHLWAPVQFHWSIFLSLCQYHTVLHSVALWYVLKSESVRPLAWFFFLNFYLFIYLFWLLRSLKVSYEF